MTNNKINSLYIIGSLRNSNVADIANIIRSRTNIDVFDDWQSPGPEADDHWKKYSEKRGQNYKEALSGWSAKHIFEFDKHHLDRCDGALLVLPAGRSCGMELGYTIGKGKPGWILLDDPERWDIMMLFATGIYDNLDDFLTMLIKQQEGK